MTRIGITGCTGHVGGLVAWELAADGHELLLLARPESLARVPVLPGSQVAAASYADRAAALRALSGVGVLFMVSAAESADRVAEHVTFIEAAAAAGVSHIVYTSFFGAAPDSTFLLGRDHWLTEQAITASGMRFTMLRDNLYLDILPEFAGPDGVIRGPAGSGRVAGVARTDVARVAAQVLREPDQHAGRAYSLTGPQGLTLAEVAAIASEVTGRRITYHDETLEEARQSRAGFGAPSWQVDAWISTYTAIAAGELDGPTDDVQAVTGRAPLSLRQVLSA